MSVNGKSKHVVFDDHDDVDMDGPVAGPASSAAPQATMHPERLAAIARDPELKPVGPAQPKRKTAAQLRYQAKKNRKHRKLVKAKKAAAPKSKTHVDGEGPDSESESSDSGTDGNAQDLAPPAAIAPLAPSQSAPVAGPSKLVASVPVVPLDAVEDEIDPDDEAARAKRKADKRAKREERNIRKAAERAKAEEDAKMERKAKKRRKNENGDVAQDDAQQGSNEAAATDNAVVVEAGPSSPRSTTSVPAPLDDDDAIEAVSDLNNDDDPDEDGRIPSASPSPLVPFPLPTPAVAPDAGLLARQGLPQGLDHADYIDQDIRIPVDDLRFTAPLQTFGMEGNGTIRGLGEKVKSRLKSLGVNDFFAVQAKIIPELMSYPLVAPYYSPPPDYIISAPTGSGKTLAYSIPLVDILSRRVVPRLRALIVLPTRELVVQVKETVEALCKGTGLVVGSVTGQHSFVKEQEALILDADRRLIGGSSRVDILIATPGRLMDHLGKTPNFTLQHLRFLIIDEADRLLSQSFNNWLPEVLAHINPPTGEVDIPTEWEHDDLLADAWLAAYKRVDVDSEFYRPAEVTCQKLLFSATLTRDPAKVAALNLNSPRYYIVQSTGTTANPAAVGTSFALPSTLSEKMIILPAQAKPLSLLYIVHASAYRVRSALVFTKSVESAGRLVRLIDAFEDAWMGRDGERVVARQYTGEMKPSERKKLLDAFAQGTVHILVCSDVIARGMDLPSVEHVVSYDIPLDMRKYVHRVGRTARAGRQGTAWSLVEKQEALHFKGMLKDAGHNERVKKVKVKEDDLAPYRESYEIAMKRLQAESK